MADEKKKVKKAKARPSFVAEIRAAKNATVRERNLYRKAQRRKEAEERNAAYQSMSLEQQLAACKASPFNKAKQITKLKRKIEEQNERNRERESRPKAGNPNRHGNDGVRGKRDNGAS